MQQKVWVPVRDTITSGGSGFKESQLLEVCSTCWLRFTLFFSCCFVVIAEQCKDSTVQYRILFSVLPRTSQRVRLFGGLFRGRLGALCHCILGLLVQFVAY